MTLLQALAARYDRMEGAPAEGFAPAKIHFTIVLRPDGSVAAVERQPRDGKGRLLGEVAAPQAPKRTVAVASGAFWDKTSYVLGRTANDPAASPEQQAKAAKRCADEHAAFRDRHHALTTGEDEGLRALAAFLRDWKPQSYDALEFAVEMLDQNVAFRLESENGFLHDRPAAHAALAAETAAREGGLQGLCLVTGEPGPIARLHPAIKGVPGAQSSGAALVSFNLDAFNSYGRSQGYNAPVSEATAFKYGASLNHLLSRISGRGEKGEPRFTNRIRLGDDTTVVFWAETPEAEDLVSALFTPTAAQETTKVREVMEALQAGRGLDDLDFRVERDTRVYILGLSPNAARLSVRFWREDTLGQLAERFREHWADLRLDPPVSGGAVPVWRLLLELAAQRKSENVPAHLAGEIMRSILTGARYPAALLSQTVMRIRADQDRPDPKNPQRTLEKVSPLRVAMMKAWLARDGRKRKQKEDLVALDLTNPDPAYRLGRLFAVLERLQAAALGRRNASVRDRFYAAASATPQRVFPTLIRNAANHSKKLRSTAGGGLAEWFEDQIAETLSAVEEYPPTLDLKGQGRFGIGYYHQREALHRRRAEDKTLAAAEDNSQLDTEDA